MWSKNVFVPSYEARNATLGNPEIEMILKYGFQATMDFPMALYYEQILEKFPDCKFILTVRDSSEIWFKSWDTLLRSITQPSRIFGFVPVMNRYAIYMRWLSAMVNKDNSYFDGAHPRPDQQKEPSIASYEAHNSRVREVIPEHQLLEYSVKEGWEPLCKFLEIQNCPTTPFPKSNSARSVQVQSISAAVVPLIIVLFCLFYACSATFQKCTGLPVLQWLSKKVRKFNNYMSRNIPKMQQKSFKQN